MQLKCGSPLFLAYCAKILIFQKSRYTVNIHVSLQPHWCLHAVKIFAFIQEANFFVETAKCIMATMSTI